MSVSMMKLSCETEGCNFAVEVDDMEALKGHADKPCPDCGVVYLDNDSAEAAEAIMGLIDIAGEIVGDDAGDIVPVQIKISSEKQE